MTGPPPHPGAVGLLLGVVQDAPPQRGPGPALVELGRPLKQLVQAGEAGRPAGEVGDVPGPLRLDPRQHVDQDELADQFRRLGAERDGREAAEGHADDCPGVRGERPDRRRDIGRVAVRVQRARRTVAGAIRVAVPGEVDGHQGTVKRHRHRVPGMGVLGSAVQQDQLRAFRGFRVPVLPHQRAQPPPLAHVGEGAPHGRRAVEGQPVLGGVLVEQSELVVVHPFGHRVSSSWAGDSGTPGYRLGYAGPLTRRASMAGRLTSRDASRHNSY